MPSTLRFDHLRQSIGELATLLDSRPGESTLLAQAHPLLAELVRQNDWLPEDCVCPDPQRYQQYLLHVDSRRCLSMVSSVQEPDQITLVHDHRIWGLIGMSHGAEYSQPYAFDAGGRPHPSGTRRRLKPGEVEALSPRIGDMYQVSNVFSDCTPISIHVYSANIDAVRHTVPSTEGEEKPSISGYSNSRLPSIWDLSKEDPV